MRIANVFSILFGTSLWVAGGCVPATWTETPRLSGRVVTTDHQPVSNATVTVKQVADHVGRPGESFQMTTDAHGLFFHSERTRWALVPFVPIDALVPAYVATAGANGRQSKPFCFGGDGIIGPHWLGLVNNANRNYDLHDLVLEQTDHDGARKTE
jgi:hypothetical protein